ncbi:hypothetical protein VV02_04850 [Luteipulveratus mongoliensis]|uniref:Uncharacterized protein n=1 Tax=Luteipulveratus mongoliensis TaxID=571913 RepID=A0A0K1JF49_9MICO|nr:hypothetical protein VV02_04850 [Luteipulveratus mongoliensis]
MWAALGLVAVLGALLVGWQVSSGSAIHRAREQAASLRTMPGVERVVVTDPTSDDPDLIVALRPEARTDDVRDLIDRAGAYAERTNGPRVDVSAGHAHALVTDNDGDPQQAARILTALATLSRGEAETFGSGQVAVNVPRAEAIPVASEVVRRLLAADLSDTHVSVGGDAAPGVVELSTGSDLKSAGTLLARLAPLAPSGPHVDVGRHSVRLELRDAKPADAVAAMRTVQSAARAAWPGEDASASVELNGPRPLTIDGQADPRFAARVIQQLDQRGFPVSSVSTELDFVTVEVKGARDLPDLSAAVRRLSPALPSGSRVRTSWDHGRFAGTTAELERQAPRIAALELQGYAVLWQSSPGGTASVSLGLPEGTDLNAQNVTAAARMIRSMPWPGTAQVSLVQLPPEGADVTKAAIVQFSSTATGTAGKVTDNTFQSFPAATKVLFVKAWNATATSDVKPR